MAALFAILEGPGLIVRDMSPAFAGLAKSDLLGRPICEAYCEDEYGPVIGFLEYCMAHGQSLTTGWAGPNGLEGIIRIRPTGRFRLRLEFRRAATAARPSPGFALPPAVAAAMPVLLTALMLA